MPTFDTFATFSLGLPTNYLPQLRYCLCLDHQGSGHWGYGHLDDFIWHRIGVLGYRVYIGDMGSQWLIFRVLDEPLKGIVACYWLGPSRVVMRGTRVGLLGKNLPRSLQKVLSFLCWLHAGYDVGMMLELGPPQNLLLAHYWLHVGLAHTYPMSGCGP